MRLERDEISLLSHKRLDNIITSKQFKYTPKKVQDNILDLRDLIDRY